MKLMELIMMDLGYLLNYKFKSSLLDRVKPA